MPQPFISTTDLGDYLGRTVTADNAAIAAVASACQICRTIAGQDFDETLGDTIVLDGSGTDCLLLPQLPVTRAGTVVLSGGTLVENQDYVLADERMLIRTAGAAYTNGNGCVWTAGRQNVQVTYDHGFAGTIPDDVRRVALGLARRLLVQGEAVYETLGPGQQIRYQGPPMDLSATEKLVLDRYRSR